MKIKTCMFAVIGLTTLLAGQSNSALQKDSATFDADGTAYVTRIVPMPTTIRPLGAKLEKIIVAVQAAIPSS